MLLHTQQHREGTRVCVAVVPSYVDQTHTARACSAACMMVQVQQLSRKWAENLNHIQAALHVLAVCLIMCLLGNSSRLAA